MSKRLYVIYDKKAQVYTPPMVYHNDGAAMRDLQMQMRRNPESPFAVFGADYDLVKIADWDERSGKVGVMSRVVVTSLDQLQATPSGEQG